ncbi:DUF5333 domain-containing protein [Profundibacterium mesophilum]|uniref:NADH dehydrogenase subunit E n=1 Tax=Profundibacterium mesophilum KAUST100406-0324 TaxID=1037889 RepID=A0A921TBU6_9RHOB|nr:DUF5333 domain-containing protein [Profundibacterium mesophilum]KAF0674863.1 hypothetical protein PMES_02939 [Profundibacterium mesophilum KAUST100406-0324]
MPRTVILAAMLGALAAPAFAKPPLHQNETVRSGFYAIGLADEVRKNCPSISPRMIRAWTYLKSLEGYARDAGYSRDEISALTDNKAEKEKLRAVIRDDLRGRGAVPGKPEGYCAVGREEIAADSAAGRLLKGD